jgi:hypothetical protein
MSDSIENIAKKLKDGFQEVQVSLAQSLGALFFPANRDQGHSRLPQGKTGHLMEQEYGCLPNENSNSNESVESVSSTPPLPNIQRPTRIC